MKSLVILPIWFAVTLAPIKALSIPSAIASAHAIVVADITSGNYDGTQYSLTLRVHRTLQGTLQPGVVIQATYLPTNRATREGSITKEQGVFFLQAAQAAWSLVSAESDGIGLRSVYLPITGPGPATTAASVADKVVQELATAAENSQDAQYTLRFVSKFPANSSPLVMETLRHWAAMPISVRHAYGLAGLIASSDMLAVQQFAVELPEILKLPNASHAGSSLNGFRSSDPLAVAAVGRIALTVSAPPAVRSAAAWALSNIHSKETLTYLYALLDSPDQTTRELAIKGFSGFVTNLRMANDGLDSSEALDSVLNPGRNQKAASSFDNPHTREFVHFGAFQDIQQERSFIIFWKLWFEQNRGLLGS